MTRPKSLYISFTAKPLYLRGHKYILIKLFYKFSHIFLFYLFRQVFSFFSIELDETFAAMWKIKVPPKVTLFVWIRGLKNRLPTRGVI